MHPVCCSGGSGVTPPLLGEGPLPRASGWTGGKTQPGLGSSPPLTRRPFGPCSVSHSGGLSLTVPVVKGETEARGFARDGADTEGVRPQTGHHPPQAALPPLGVGVWVTSFPVAAGSAVCGARGGRGPAGLNLRLDGEATVTSSQNQWDDDDLHVPHTQPEWRQESGGCAGLPER